MASFCVPKINLVKASSLDIRINEVYPYPDSCEEEFIEIKNFGEEAINLKNWTIRDAGNHKYKIEGDLILAKEEIALIERNFYLNNKGFEAVYLLDPNGIEQDGTSYENAPQGFSWRFLENNWDWMKPSKGKENKKKPEENPPNEYSNEIRINEFLPNPSDNESEEEYIEIYNFSKEAINLLSWSLRDSSKNGEYIFSQDSFIESNSFLSIYRSDFSFAINNSNESIYLLNPEKEIVSQVSFLGSAKEDISYNFFNEEKWRWSNHLTPGEKNKFDKFPSFNIELPNKIFKNIYADFEIEIDDAEETKVKWNFGDKKTSIQRKARHKYKETGTFIINLSLVGNSETIQKEFEIDVEKFENEDIEIIALSPNPKGTDYGKEWIEIKNNGKKRVNLKNWIIATGNKNLYNHPIEKDFFIQPKKSKKISQKKCAFSLGNNQSKIELRYPDKRRMDKVKYKKEKIAEEEIYLKINKKWIWQENNKPEKNQPGEKNQEKKDDEKEKESLKNKINKKDMELLGKISVVKNKKQNQKKYLSPRININLEKIKINNDSKIAFSNNFYSFTSSRNSPHWLITFFSNFNKRINLLFLKLTS